MSIKTNILFVDRSVFESENFFFGLKIKQLAAFSKERIIEMKITEVTYRELQKGLKDNLIKSKNALKQVRKDGRLLRNLPKYDSLHMASNLDVEKDYNELSKLLGIFIKDNHIEIIDNGYINLERVIDNYFTGTKPFGEGHKKSEFPDAFILSAIEEYCEKKNLKSYVLSLDNDMIEYESGSGNVLVKNSIGELISDLHKYRHKNTFNFIDARAYQNNYEIANFIEKEYSHYFDEELAQIINDNPFYEDSELDIEGISVGALIKHNILELDSKTVTIEYLYVVEVTANLTYNDLSKGFYDKEYGQWWGEEHVNEEKTYEAEVRITVNHSFSLKEKAFSINIVQRFEIESFEEV